MRTVGARALGDGQLARDALQAGDERFERRGRFACAWAVQGHGRQRRACFHRAGETPALGGHGREATALRGWGHDAKAGERRGGLDQALDERDLRHALDSQRCEGGIAHLRQVEKLHEGRGALLGEAREDLAGVARLRRDQRGHGGRGRAAEARPRAAAAATDRRAATGG